mmetsp:Transcript_10327/g.19301  ORF Transcript_10327/g.19301 Transcript_10327/m.19301 type:complete len:283 (+) Transcript_10327:630-1478(+)
MGTFDQQDLNVIESIVKTFMTIRHHAGHWNFMTSTTFGFVGSSIAESTYSTLKRGPNAVSAKFSLEKSAFMLLKQSKSWEKKLNSKMAEDINRRSLYSRSKASPYITDYMDGLSIKYFHNRHKVKPLYVGHKKWLVMRANFFDTEQDVESSIMMDDAEGITEVYDNDYRVTSYHPKFEHIRSGSIDVNNRMKCACCKFHNYLAPCIHIMAVLKKTEYIIPELFHMYIPCGCQVDDATIMFAFLFVSFSLWVPCMVTLKNYCSLDWMLGVIRCGKNINTMITQ